MRSLEVEKHSVQWSFKRQITEIVLLILFLFPGKANVALTLLLLVKLGSGFWLSSSSSEERQ